MYVFASDYVLRCYFLAMQMTFLKWTERSNQFWASRSLTTDGTNQLLTEFHGPSCLTERIRLSFTIPFHFKGMVSIRVEYHVPSWFDGANQFLTEFHVPFQVTERINSLTISFQRFWQKLLYFTVAMYEWMNIFTKKCLILWKNVCLKFYQKIFPNWMRVTFIFLAWKCDIVDEIKLIFKKNV